MQFLSKTCVYGIRAVLYLASAAPQKPYMPISQISQELQLSFHYLTKIFQILAAHNLISSYRGPNGGVSLARPAQEITLMDLVSAIEGENIFTGCILALPGCGEDTPCPLHQYWGEERERIKSIFENTTLAELGQQIIADGLRLVPGTNGQQHEHR